MASLPSARSAVTDGYHTNADTAEPAGGRRAAAQLEAQLVCVVNVRPATTES